jgi:hypothetical protein
MTSLTLLHLLALTAFPARHFLYLPGCGIATLALADKPVRYPLSNSFVR